MKLGMRLKHSSPWIALAGVTICAVIGGVLGVIGHDSLDFWLYGLTFYWSFSLLALGAGHLLAGWPELFRRGETARRFARAEWRNGLAGRSVAGRVFWWLLFVAAWSSILAIVIIEDDFSWIWASADEIRSYYRSGFYRRAYPGDIVAGIGISAIIAGFVISLLLPLVVATATAMNLASSRRSGAAENLLMAPATADYLGWAAVRAQSFRGLLTLLVALPLYAIALTAFSLEWRHETALSALWTMLVLLPALVLIELLMIKRAAALGAWLGASVRFPVLAAALAAILSILFWLLRVLTVLLCFVIADELWYDNPLEFWMAPPLAVVFELLLFALAAPLFMRLARGALTAPLGLRLGAWMVRTGRRLFGLGPEGDLLRPPSTVLFADSQARFPGWRTAFVGVWIFAVLVFFLFPAAVMTAWEFNRSGGLLAGILFFTALAVLLGLFLGAWFLLRFVLGRSLRAAKTGLR